ncbi:acetyl-CoA hydrolase/transferase family protein [Clostridium scatologenes]|uniref:Cat1 n=1 Tax=Clostridium scatologenes TaxID=1548 RepID=A0A0E3JQ60_CLOSL|nr:acetyl-CoA hydrolase/transferase family protein [Clostridium scatologenes]AKA70742.1 Cat1 [Clostridium scatologenes]
MNGRIRNSEILKRVVSAEKAAELIKDGMVIGISGFTPSGYPKAVPSALTKRVNSTGEKMKLSVYTGASVGPEIDGDWSKAGIIARRLPYQTNKELRNGINDGSIEYTDMHLSHVAQYVNYGILPKIDIAIVEAVSITEEGFIVPSTGIGNSVNYIQNADKVIVEVNENQPIELEGLSDVYTVENPPCRKPIPMTAPGDRIGTTYIPCDLDKIAAVVITNLMDKTRPLSVVDDVSKAISKNLIKFLEKEVSENRLPKDLLPIQSGVGSVANAVLAGLCDSDFENLTCYTEVIQDSMLDLLRCGKAKLASGTSLSPSPEGVLKFREDIDFFKDKIILRPQEISNNPEVIRRLGLISINTALEIDIFGNVNSTHVMGSKMMNGIGGSGDFARNAYLTIFTTESIAKKGCISSIVPMVSHTDHTEHDVMVIITEQGVADLRGLSPKERAYAIINNCAHPDYKPMLLEYLKKGLKESPSKHTPHLLEEALSWHVRFIKTGTMKNN